MDAITQFESRSVVLATRDIDTDQIIPARFLTTTSREGMGEFLFHDLRLDSDGNPIADFILNRPEADGCEILVGGNNFGCGSSREHAPWALLDYGFRVVVSTSFADIFRNNAGKNGLLAAVVSPSDHATMVEATERAPAAEVTVDLESGRIESAAFDPIEFEVEPFARHCLLKGLDQFGVLLDLQAQIEAYEASHPQRVSTLQRTPR